MRSQTETSFLSAGGEPSTSMVPRKRPRTKPKVPEGPAPVCSADHSEWKPAVFNLRAHFDSQLHSLGEELQTLTAASSLSQPSPELRGVSTDIANLQKRVAELSSITTTRLLEHYTAIEGLVTSVSPITSLTSSLTRTVGRVTNLEGNANQNGPSPEAYRVLEARVAELEKTLLSVTSSVPLSDRGAHPPSAVSNPDRPSASTSRPDNIRRQIVINCARMSESVRPWNLVAQMMGCIPTLSVAAVTTVDPLPAPPGFIIVTFRTDQNAQDFMTAARSLPDLFRDLRFSWADSPSSPVKPTPSPAPSTTGPFVDERRG